MNNEKQLNQQIAMFYFAYKSFTDSLDAIISPRGLSHLHHRILFFAEQIPGMTTSELTKILEISKQALAKPLRELKEKGLIYIAVSEEDQRKRTLFLTSTGIHLMRDLSRQQQKQFIEAYKQAGDPGGTTFTAVLKEFAKDRPGMPFIDQF